MLVFLLHYNGWIQKVNFMEQWEMPPFQIQFFILLD